jgi:hypothetical protein
MTRQETRDGDVISAEGLCSGVRLAAHLLLK